MHCVCQSSTARCPPKLIQRCRKVGMETEITRGGTQEIGSTADAAAVSGGVRSAHRLHRAARAIGWRDSRESILCVSAAAVTSRLPRAGTLLVAVGTGDQG